MRPGVVGGDSQQAADAAGDERPAGAIGIERHTGQVSFDGGGAVELVAREGHDQQGHAMGEGLGHAVVAAVRHEQGRVLQECHLGQAGTHEPVRRAADRCPRDRLAPMAMATRASTRRSAAATRARTSLRAERKVPSETTTSGRPSAPRQPGCRLVVGRLVAHGTARGRRGEAGVPFVPHRGGPRGRRRGPGRRGRRRHRRRARSPAPAIAGRRS